MTYVIADMTYCPPVLKTRVPSPLPGQHVWLNVSRLDQAEQFKSYRDAMIAYTDLIKCGHLHEQICIVYTGNLGAAGENRDVAASKEPKILAKLAAQLAACDLKLQRHIHLCGALQDYIDYLCEAEKQTSGLLYAHDWKYDQAFLNRGKALRNIIARLNPEET